MGNINTNQVIYVENLIFVRMPPNRIADKRDDE